MPLFPVLKRLLPASLPAALLVASADAAAVVRALGFKPDGAERVDTSELDLEGVVERLERLARARLGDRLPRTEAASRP